MSISQDQFEDLVRDVLDALPEPFASVLAHVAVVVEPQAPPDDPDLYGLYLGSPLTEPGASHEPPPRVAVYMRPLMDDVADEEELREEVRITVLHELGHHLGMDEDQLDRLGYG